MKSFSIDCVCSMYMYCMCVCVHMPSHRDKQGHVPRLEMKGLWWAGSVYYLLSSECYCDRVSVCTTRHQIKAALGSLICGKTQKKKSTKSSDLESQSETNLSRQLELHMLAIPNKNRQRIATVWWRIVMIRPWTVTAGEKPTSLQLRLYYQQSETLVLEIVTKQANILWGF